MPFSTTFGDQFYARADGRAEADYVFIQGNNLPERWRSAKAFAIGELGFGTGLNFLETWRQWEVLRTQDQKLRFVSFEAYPMPFEHMAKAIGRWPELAEVSMQFQSASQTLHPGANLFQLDEQTELQIIVGDAREQLSSLSVPVDAWFLDGFSPAKNPQLWEATLLNQLAAKTVLGGTFATYTAASWVRRNLQAAGFEVEKRPGFGTKREMMVGKLPI